VFETNPTHERILDQALAVLAEREDGLFAALDELPAPIYVTDAAGSSPISTPPASILPGARRL